MSPILVRPVREQLEHDRIIRLLQAKYKRKFEVAINPGNEQNTGVGGPPPWFPDLVLQNERGKKLLGVVEVETVESVNHLEAMSEWRAFGQFRTAFHLYVPTSMMDVARRLCEDMQIVVAEFWAYTVIGDQPRFTLVQRTAVPESKGRPMVVATAAVAPRPAAASAPHAAAAPRPAAAAPRPAAPRPAATPVAARSSSPNGETRSRGRAAAPAAPAARRKTAAKKTARPAARRAAPRKPAARPGRAAPKKSASSARAQKRK